MTPFFTIITCTKNSAKYIKKCLESVKSQTFRDFEHIIVDGKSNDGTLEVFNSSDINPIILEPQGIAHAMNEGIRAARGKYIYFLNSDDSFYDSHVLEQVHDYLTRHKQFDWVFGNIHETDGQKTIGYPPIRNIFKGRHPNLLKYYNYIPHQGTFIQKAVFDKYGLFDETLKSMMDPEYWLRISGKTKWDYMPIVVAHYLIRPDSQSENVANAISNTKEYEKVQKQYLNWLEFLFAKIVNKFLR